MSREFSEISRSSRRGASCSTTWFEEARYGLFIHFGLYSLIGRGEWTMNREGISPAELREVAARFDPTGFDANAIADLAVAGGMKYLVFTTMHHEGFRMYDSELSDFCSTKLGPKRDFTAEIIAAGRKRGLKIGLYHSLNNWYDQPDGVAALESPADYETFIKNTHARIRELVTRYNPIDILWYDGWWPFDARGWRAKEMNAMVREIQPHILFNGRNGLAGDFATPEQHLAVPQPWRPWEACMTLNNNWGFHAGDQNWKSPTEIIKLLVRAAQGRGNVLLNIGPRGDGTIPSESENLIRTVGEWLKTHGECLRDTDLWTFDPHNRGEHRADWCHHGPMTASGNNLYLIATCEPPDRLVIRNVEAKVQEVIRLGEGSLPFSQIGEKVEVELPPTSTPTPTLPRVYKFACDRPPTLYGTGGMRPPTVEHPRYDPMPSDIAW